MPGKVGHHRLAFDVGTLELIWPTDFARNLEQQRLAPCGYVYCLVLTILSVKLNNFALVVDNIESSEPGSQAILDPSHDPFWSEYLLLACLIAEELCMRKPNGTLRKPGNTLLMYVLCKRYERDKLSRHSKYV